jgi:hypothetical protein
MVLPANEIAESIAEGSTPVNVHAGSGLAVGNAVVLADAAALEKNGLTQAAGGLSIVGSGGFNSALAQNFDALQRSGFGVDNVNAGRSGR